jgi:PAS domain S-box-containing protein
MREASTKAIVGFSDVVAQRRGVPMSNNDDSRESTQRGGQSEQAETVRQLEERVKELSCVHDISRILLGAKSHRFADALGQIVERIPAGWQFPEIAVAHIRLGDDVRESRRFERTPWIQRREFDVTEEIDGCIEVAYLEDPYLQTARLQAEHVDADGPFLVEEERLLETIASRLVEAGRRAHAEQQVRIQAALLAAVGEAVVASDREGRVTYWNRRAEQLFGWSAAEALGENVVTLTSSEDSLAAADEIMASLRRGESWSGEFELARKDGTSFPAHVTDSPIFDDDGEVIGVVGITRDIQKRRELEAQLRQAQKLEAVGRLAGGIAHDFNNMLTAIQGNAELLSKDMANDESLLESVHEIEQAARRAADLTSQLLAFSRQQVLQPKVLSLGRVVGEIKPMLDRLLGERIELRVQVDSDLGHVRADEGQLSQVIMNLVINSRDAMPNGGQIGLGLENVELEPTQRDRAEEAPAGQYVVLSVSDTGTGIVKELHDSIFEPFFSTKADGSGLGLSMVYGIVKQSGGYLQVDSKPGAGTEMRVYLPRVNTPDSEPRAVTEQAAPTKPAVQRTILVCEDEPMVRRLARRALERQGYRVLSAATGEEALELLEEAEETEETIDLLLSDIVMPQMGGLKLAAKLNERWPQIKVLLMSGYPSRDVLDESALEISLPFLEKPFSFQELCEKVAMVLDLGGLNSG